MATKLASRPTPLFEYRIVEGNFEGDKLFMPQRGVPDTYSGVTSRYFWCDALPASSPTLELALRMLAAIKAFDAIETTGRVVEETSTI
jgi:hypothetical protein